MNGLAVFARLGNRRVAFDAADIEAVLDLGEIVPVPLTRSHVRGLTAVRSQVMTVIDVETALDGRPPSSQRRRALIVTHKRHRYALLVDAVDEVAVPRDSSSQIPPGLGTGWARAARGTMRSGEELALGLDIGSIIAPAD